MLTVLVSDLLPYFAVAVTTWSVAEGLMVAWTIAVV